MSENDFIYLLPLASRERKYLRCLTKKDVNLDMSEGGKVRSIKSFKAVYFSFCPGTKETKSLGKNMLPRARLDAGPHFCRANARVMVYGSLLSLCLPCKWEYLCRLL